MAIRKMVYTVSVAGLEPSTKQFCGVQGDHNIYSLEFGIEAELWNDLQGEAENGTLYYHFDLYNGEGAVSSTEPKTLENSTVTLDVGEWLTRYGGVGKAVLVITLSENGITHSELYSFPALLQFKSRPTGSEPDEEEYQSMTTLFQKAKQAAYDAEAARLQAQEASDSASDVRTALDKGMVLKLEGQRAEGIAEIFEAISSEVTETGENAVSGAAVFAALKNIEEGLKDAINSIKAEAIKEAHPVGSLYWSKEPDNPKTLFGGEWERIKDKFILAAGDEYTVENEGGAKEVTLLEENIAEHKHKGLFYTVTNLPIGMKRADSADGYAFAWAKGTVYTPGSMITGSNLDSNEKPAAINIMPPYKAYYCWIRTE